MIGEGMSREEKLQRFRETAMIAWGNGMAHPDRDPLAGTNMEKAATWIADLADAMMAECDRRDKEARKKDRE